MALGVWKNIHNIQNFCLKQKFEFVSFPRRLALQTKNNRHFRKIGYLGWKTDKLPSIFYFCNFFVCFWGITKLVLSRNKMKDGTALQFYSGLHELNLDVCQLTAKFFYRLKENSVVIDSLRILYINKNKISNLDILLNCLCEVTPNLE